MKVTHRPRGSMCMNCSSKTCPKPEEFKDLRPIGKDKDGVIVVLCNKYSK